MNLNPFLFTALCIALLGIMFLVTKLKRVRAQLALIEDVLVDINSGNSNRRLLAGKNDLTKRICFAINEMALKNQSRLIRQRQSEQSYKRLMTSLSHDVKTPLASLTGYLDAIEKGLVTGEEKDAYIHVAAEKACQLRHFIETLFEWIKLDAKEQIFHFEQRDINELTRNIAAEWIPIIEQNLFEYQFAIPEEEYSLNIDPQVYARILNNLFQNALTHSGGNRLTLQISKEERQVKISLSDNGKGISPSDLPHIFERMYRCEHSRSSAGNGLGLSITLELVNALGGTIEAHSKPGRGAEFMIFLSVLSC